MNEPLSYTLHETVAGDEKHRQESDGEQAGQSLSVAGIEYQTKPPVIVFETQTQLYTQYPGEHGKAGDTYGKVTTIKDGENASHSLE